jgi:3-oxoacyl-[acyl-carrier protein] reductase
MIGNPPPVEPLRVQVVGSGPLARRVITHLEDQGALVNREESDGSIDALVFAPWDPVDIQPKRFVSMTDTDFASGWQEPVDAAVAACVNAFRRMAEGGSIVLTVPTTAMSGGANYGAAAAGFEGIRILAKSAARQWGAKGIVVNCVAVAPRWVLGDPAAVGTASIAPAALVDDDPAAAVLSLCRAAEANITGQTVTVDAGVWM